MSCGGCEGTEFGKNDAVSRYLVHKPDMLRRICAVDTVSEDGDGVSSRVKRTAVSHAVNALCHAADNDSPGFRKIVCDRICRVTAVLRHIPRSDLGNAYLRFKITQYPTVIKHKRAVHYPPQPCRVERRIRRDDPHTLVAAEGNDLLSRAERLSAELFSRPTRKLRYLPVVLLARFVNVADRRTEIVKKQIGTPAARAAGNAEPHPQNPVILRHNSVLRKK
ncbi:unknown [Candidatus Colimorpha enterica]|uniref:Uncharacterized protein n=1 Tax=Candidatus Colimorpha enterica TaxID=3083063 RepID=R6UH42_9BACT|nr:unknown [Candidatus Colimorpha enterica]